MKSDWNSASKPIEPEVGKLAAKYFRTSSSRVLAN
jgi:hypothetical protein